MIWLIFSALAMVITAFLHSFFGEKRLITPILNSGIPVATNPLGAFVIRFAWHLTTVLMLLSAAAVLWPHSPRGLVMANGVIWLAAGVFDAFASKGKHIGWPPIVLAGAFAVMGAPA